MGLIDELNALKERATSDIRHLQDFHVFTGHSYDRYDKMVAAEHPTDSVTNVRTGNTFDAKQIAELLLKYLDEDLPRVVVYQLVSHFEAFRSDLVKLLRQQNPRALNQRRQIIFAEPDMARLAELKATRDIIAHNAGIANSTYLRKAGTLARAQLGERLKIDRPYTYEAGDFLSRLVVDLINAATARLSPSDN